MASLRMLRWAAGTAVCWIESGTWVPVRRGSPVLSAVPWGRLTRGRQQAPGFCAQKSSNFWAFDPAGGGVSLLWLSAPVDGAAAPPPLDVVSVPVLVPPVPEVSV